MIVDAVTAQLSDLPYPERGVERQVRTLVALGDSTTVGIGDRIRGGWRGFAPLVADALHTEPAVVGPRRHNAPVRLDNLSFPGARIADVRKTQLPVALSAQPEAAILVAGMNDTLRADFDPDQLHDDLDSIVASLTNAGAVVVTAKYHDHSKVFKIPGPLSRALTRRIDELNEILDNVVTRYGAQCLDLADIPGAYELPAWSVDRLHPSELGHRMLARGFGELLAEAGCAVPRPVSLECSGGRRPSAAEHVLWLVLKGLPWLIKRAGDLLPYAARIWWRDLRGLDPLAPKRKPTWWIKSKQRAAQATAGLQQQPHLSITPDPAEDPATP